MSHKPFRWMVSLLLGLMIFLSVGGAVAQGSVGTAFTYQGHLSSGTSPVNNTCDFEFSLWDSASGATGQIGSTLTRPNVNVVNGLFTVQLDFGNNVFMGDARWLEVRVKWSGAAAFTTLAPRQELTAAPYALYASSAGNASRATNFDVTGQLTVGGNVGIGTTSPQLSLHVSGLGTGAGGASLALDNSGAGGRRWDIYSTDNTFSQGPGKLIFWRPWADLYVATMALDPNGNVGIGTTNPNSQNLGRALTIGGTESGTRAVLELSGAGGTSNTVGSILFLNGTTRLGQISVTPAGAANVGFMNFLVNNGGASETEVMRVFPGQLEVDGNIYASGNICRAGGAFGGQICLVEASDSRLKTDIELLTNVLDKVQQMQGVSFVWNSKAEVLGYSSEHSQIGVIAQEVEAVFPGVVITMENGYKAVDYSKLSAILIEAIKELRAEKDGEIAALKAENAALEHRVTALEQAMGINGGNQWQLLDGNFIPPAWLFFGGLLVMGIAVARRRN